MSRLATWLTLCAALCACNSDAEQTPKRDAYASYEDCILDKLGRGQSTVASEAIIAACRTKYPPKLTAVKGDPFAPTGAGMFDDLVPQKTGPKDFGGYPCKDDCSGHKAGYRWAEDNSITDPGDCGGNSQSFIEGCEAWAEENEDD